VGGGSETDYLKQALEFLVTAGLVVPLMHRWRMSPILGYLAAGAVIGPHGLGALAEIWPILGALAIDETHGITAVAEFGVVFLLFVIGLELSLERLTTMRRWVFGVGGLQVIVASVLLAGLAGYGGLSGPAAVVIGAALALSSTAIVVEMLSGTKRLATTTGRVTFAVLLFQDLAVVPLIFLVETLGAAGGGGATAIAVGLLIAFAKAAAVIVLITLLGRLALAPLFRVAAAPRSPELFMALTLLVVVGTAVATQAAGLSMALGAFVAGLLLAETEYRRAVEAVIIPFKGLLLGAFFFSVGMGVDPAIIVRHPVAILGGMAVVLTVKGVVMLAAARVMRLSWQVGIETAFLTGPGGEFAFIVLGMAVTAGVVPAEAGAIAFAIVSLSMMVLPLYGEAGRRLARRFERLRPVEPELAAAPPEDHGRRAIVIGFGRVGEVVTGLLDAHGQPYLVVDRNPTTVTLARRRGRPVFYGDGADPIFLLRLDIAEATAVIITIQDFAIADRVVMAARRMRPDVPIIARARDAAHASHLYDLGVTDAVPETIEASFQLSEAALINLGVAMGPVIASIHDRRDAVRQQLRRARNGDA
jgi:CPA2 family monovalent cation:H+ antiporter-2